MYFLAAGMVVRSFKFNDGGAAEEGYQWLSVCLIRIADIINSHFQYFLMGIYISKQQFDEQQNHLIRDHKSKCKKLLKAFYRNMTSIC